MNNITIQYLAFFLFMIIMSSNGHTLELNSNISAGYDSNPSTLADKFNPEAATFTRIRARLSQKISSNVKTSISVNGRLYNSDGENANTSRSKFSLKYKDRIGDKIKSTLNLSANIGVYDKTYVSHTTGNIGTYGGQDLSDRYDYQWWSTSASISKKITRRLTANFGSEILVKDYEDYDITGLSNLDYRQLTFSTRWRYRFSKNHRSILNLGLAKREYDDKREITLTGSTIENSDLIYTHQKASLSHRYKITRYLSLEGTASYFHQKDSGQGYYDYNRLSSKLALRYTFLPLSNVQIKLHFRKDDYNRGDAQNNNLQDEEDTLSTREGRTVSIRFDSKLPFKYLLGKRPIKSYPTLYTLWQNKSIEANDINYTYDRQQIQAGILFHF